MKKKLNVRSLVGIGVLTALVVVLQIVSNHIAIAGVSLTLVLVPIVVGGALYGVLAGAWLGFVFGFIVVVSPATQAVFFSVAPIGTIITCFVKGILAGVGSALIFKALQKKKMLLAVILAAAACPLINTGAFIIFAYFFFQNVYMPGFLDSNLGSMFWYLIVTTIGINFLVEFVLNLVLSPAVVQIIHVVKRSH